MEGLTLLCLSFLIFQPPREKISPSPSYKGTTLVAQYPTHYESPPRGNSNSSSWQLFSFLMCQVLL